MRVLHTDSGLGNQMLDYAEYLAVRRMNPGGDEVIETILYDLPDDVPGMFSKWNGYELPRVFGLEPPLLKDRLGREAWERVVGKVRESRFWESGWDYPSAVLPALKDEGIVLKNNIKDSQTHMVAERAYKSSLPRRTLTKFLRSKYGIHVRRLAREALKEQVIRAENRKHDVFKRYEDDTYLGHSLDLHYKGFGLERIEKEVREAFTFPEITDDYNSRLAEEISSMNAVSVHARRSDLLFMNSYCYEYGFFKRAIRYIRENTDRASFYFFCDENSRGYCESNPGVFGLDFKKDDVVFVTGNTGEDSFRDMQLMAMCRHNIFTESSFGFWGGFLNPHKDKITCAPDVTILATNSF